MQPETCPAGPPCVLYTFQAQPASGTQALNASNPTPLHDEHAERSARHLRICREMAELAMQLARAAAARALEAAESVQEPANDDARPPRIAAASRTPAARLPNLPGRADPNLVFIQLCRCVRETIILEARLAAERRTVTDREAKLESDRVFAAALNARFPQKAEKPAKPAETPLWDSVKAEARGPSG